MSLIAELYTRYSDELRKHLQRKFGAGTAEAEDVVHQAFANLAALEDPAVPRNPRAYLYSTTSHIFIDERRRLSSWRRGVEPNLLISQSQADEITPERVLMAKERVALLGRVLARLPHARRRSLLLNRMHGLSCAEIARRDGYSESAVKKHITLAMAELDAGLTDTEARAPRRSIRTMAASVLVATVALLGVVAWLAASRSPKLVAEYATGLAEVRDFVLPDGSVMTLGARSSATVGFDSGGRKVTLDRGEAFFSVVHDAQRPFLVVAGESRVRDVGTRFEVRRGDAEVEVGVLEGRVEVTRATGDTGPGVDRRLTPGRAVLGAGQGIRANLHGDIAKVETVGAIGPHAWLSGRRTYIDWPLREIIADVNRYSHQQIRLADPALGELRLSASLRIAEAQQMLGSVTLALPVEVERQPTGDVVLRAKQVGRAR
jgi:transmembrane sensor